MTYSDLQWACSPYILLLCLRLFIKFYKDLSLCFNFGWQASFRWFAGCPSSVLQGRVSTFTGDGNETVRKPLKHLETEVKSLTANFSTCFMQQLWCVQERTSTCAVYLVYPRLDVEQVYISISILICTEYIACQLQHQNMFCTLHKSIK